MRSFWICSLLLSCAVSLVTPQGLLGRQGSDGKLGLFSQAADIGQVKNSGKVEWNLENETYAVSGSGKNMWFKEDEFHFVWKKIDGDFILDATAKWLSPGVDPHRKYGWMVRKNLESDSPYVDVAIHGDGLTSMQFRREKGADTEQIQLSLQAPDLFRLTRKGSSFVFSAAKSGESMTQTEALELDLGSEVYVGLFVCSHNAEVTEVAEFSNVRITKPANIGFRPYRDYIGSRLEVLEVGSGKRTVVHTVEDSLQAPNWTQDNSSLIFNRNGRLYRFDLKSRQVTEIDTGFANRNNNDHAISWDGKQLAISHHSADHGGRSMIYTLPIGGGQPQLVTEKGPSYFHCWSIDDRELLYTGQRDDELDIYRIPASGGEELRLTTTKGVDDGAEFTPDGKTIYFNSNRGGKMQIWKMNADGSQQQQVTDEPNNHWFPHVSPDGKWIAYLSYVEPIDSSDHPFYKDVVLRLRSIDGKTDRIVAYFYGGQGSINVNSWSPDSKRLAFVSNTQ